MKTYTPTPDEDQESPDPSWLMPMLASAALEKYYPELLSQLPEEQQTRIRSGDQTVWADVIKEQPELFREAPFSAMEDLAFQHLLTPKRSASEPAEQPEDSSSPLPA